MRIEDGRIVETSVEARAGLLDRATPAVLTDHWNPERDLHRVFRAVSGLVGVRLART